MNEYRILIVDDEKNQRQLLSGFLKKKGYVLFEADNGKTALELVREEQIDLLLSDMRMPGLGGLELLEAVRQENPLIEVIMITAYGTVETAVKAMQKGAYTFISKPVNLESLALNVERALEHKTLAMENRELRARIESSPVSEMVATSRKMREVLGIAARVASSKASVLIQGESGTGKELVARAIHDSGNRKEKPFVAVNIAAIPETLLASELFGHEKGSFTGASSRHIGRFERASSGTLFIDEVSEIPLSTQVKLLRVLQEGQIERVGGNSTINVDVRLIAATNQNLNDLVKEGAFREDLFYRLNVVRIDIPPLRARKADIPPLVEHFVARYTKMNGINLDGVDPSAMDMLMKYSWPGNVRELENAIESAVVLCRGNRITPRDLPQNLRKYQTDEMTLLSPTDDPSKPLLERLENLEKYEVLRALEKTRGNRSKAARLLGMSEKNIRDRLKRWEII